ncbi:MAG: hypothetical protein KKG33_01730 [candidate division Zixibacteria bacterium]|nr:hypothetical protein [candidate division Zixibacteria bacterium]MBU1470881.1 hypothetical protein [candidate division Zixibacteria bacterium]MBU2624259.1 hypothetical protein [candidate division Zixibacteria bacterium]
MSIEAYRHFKYEMALGADVPMPEPKIDFYPHNQFTLQQYLHILCKVHVGSLGKLNGKWKFGEDAPPNVRLSSRPDIVQLFDFAEKMGIIEAKPSEGGESTDFQPYQLSKQYWDKFDKYGE